MYCGGAWNCGLTEGTCIRDVILIIGELNWRLRKLEGFGDDPPDDKEHLQLRLLAPAIMCV